jgi:hypothetical protein
MALGSVENGAYPLKHLGKCMCRREQSCKSRRVMAGEKRRHFSPELAAPTSPSWWCGPQALDQFLSSSLRVQSASWPFRTAEAAHLGRKRQLSQSSRRAKNMEGIVIQLHTPICGISFSLSRRARLAQAAHPIPRSSTRSRGVPQTRQMTAVQSPQTSGSDTGFSHFGQ